MNKTQKITLALLVIGLIFSSLLRIAFNVSDGFVFQRFLISVLPLPIFDYAGNASNELNLTTTILGYFFYLFAGFVLIKKNKDDKKWYSFAVGFVLILVTAIIFEGSSIVLDLKSEFVGQHLRIGPALFILGFLTLTKNLKVFNLKR